MPANADAGSRHPDCRGGSEIRRADAPVPRDEGAIRRPRELEYAISPEGLYDAMSECVKGTDWKRSVAAFELNGWERCISLSESLNDGTYTPRKPIRFEITHPKRRECCSIGIRDRVFQRSLNDNVVYPQMSRSLIPANCACQKGKGTDYARERLKKMLRRHWHHNGTEGYALLMDIRGYYPNMRHEVALAEFEKRLDKAAYSMVKGILASQYSGDVGFQAGSQLVQIAGISVLNPLDHFIKERLVVKAYLRYMDDMVCLGKTKVELETVRDAVAAELEKVGMALHPSKTRIQRIDGPIPFLGFTFTLKRTGFVLVRVKPGKLKGDIRRLRRIGAAVRAGRIALAKSDEIVGTMTRYLRSNCSGAAAAVKVEREWSSLRGGLDVS